jgi:hypothetical protein
MPLYGHCGGSKALKDRDSRGASPLTIYLGAKSGSFITFGQDLRILYNNPPIVNTPYPLTLPYEIAKLLRLAHAEATTNKADCDTKLKTINK